MRRAPGLVRDSGGRRQPKYWCGWAVSTCGELQQPPQSLVNLNQGQESPKDVFRLGEKSSCGKQTHTWTTGAKPGLLDLLLAGFASSFLGKDLCWGLISLKMGGKSWRLMTCLFSGKDQPWWDKQGAEGKGSSSSSEECVGQLYDSVRPSFSCWPRDWAWDSVIPFF